MKVRLTQKNLIFGIYWGGKECMNAGLNVWWLNRYIWPLKRGHGKQLPKAGMLFALKETGDAVGNVSDESGSREDGVSHA